MDTIKHYEKTKTTELQLLLKELEMLSEKNEILIENNKELKRQLKKQNDDYEIDIRLIRMELSKRLWKTA